MWGVPGLGIEPVTPALAGGPPGKRECVTSNGTVYSYNHLAHISISEEGYEQWFLP